VGIARTSDRGRGFLLLREGTRVRKKRVQGAVLSYEESDRGQRERGEIQRGNYVQKAELLSKQGKISPANRIALVIG